MDLSRTMKSLVFGLPALIKGGQPGYRAGEAQLAINVLGAPGGLLVESGAFSEGGPLPSFCAIGQGNRSPHLRWSFVPREAQSLALIAEDPDAPTVKPFVHWLLWNIDVALPELREGARFPVEGRSSTLRRGFTGAAPPKGDRPHRYHFQLFALDRLLDLPDGAGRSALLKAMHGRVLAAGDLVGTHGR